MKLAVAILLGIFSQLTAGYGFAKASGHDNLVCAPTSGNCNRICMDPGRRFLLSHDIGQNQEDTVLARADDDDEETINRKYLPVTGYFLAFTWALISTDRYALHTEHSSIWRDLSCPGSRIYIAQRVLRI